MSNVCVDGGGAACGIGAVTAISAFTASWLCEQQHQFHFPIVIVRWQRRRRDRL